MNHTHYQFGVDSVLSQKVVYIRLTEITLFVLNAHAPTEGRKGDRTDHIYETL